MKKEHQISKRRVLPGLTILLALHCVLFAPCVAEQLALPPLFSDHAVLQSGMDVPVWGIAASGEKVTVEFAGQSRTATADEKGEWALALKPLDVSTTPREMKVSAGTESLTVKDILVGEVWLCSGQSNMERELGPRPQQPLILNWEQEAAAADFPRIREFRCAGRTALAQGARADAKGQWVTCSPDTAPKFSAVAYFFARELHKARKVPVGIIVGAVGATPAEMWISKESAEAIMDVVPDGLKPAISSHYGNLIQPLQPLALRGVVWYQGESNNERAVAYEKVMTCLIKDWRQAWKRELPFLYVQIPPHAFVPAELREGQLLTSQKLPRTAMVVTMDCGYKENPQEWHPPDKAPIGARLALAARAIAYDEKIVYSGPVYKHMEVKGPKAIVHFTHVGDGLLAKDGDLKGFEIAGSDGKFVKALAAIRGDTVEVSSPDVAKPVTVTYGWARIPDVNLFNKDGLPASPFRTGPCPTSK